MKGCYLKPVLSEQRKIMRMKFELGCGVRNEQLCLLAWKESDVSLIVTSRKIEDPYKFVSIPGGFICVREKAYMALPFVIGLVIAERCLGLGFHDA